MVNVVLAGGGTAGHTSPLIATAEALLALDPGVVVTCLGTARGLETRVIPLAGLPLELIPPVPMPRSLTPDLLRLPGRLAGAVSQASRILRDKQADVLVGFGGYVAMPAYLAARRLRIPVVIDEQNAVPGLANKVASRFAKRVVVAFPDTPLPKAEFIGLPLRRAVAELAAAGRDSLRAEALTAFGLQPGRRTLLVSGGSQGARSINNALLAARDRLLQHGVQVLHVWGPKNLPADAAVIVDDATGAGYHPVGYVERMELAYAAADLMVGRSGAATVFETAVIGLPGIFVPLPHGNGEQEKNASTLVSAGGAVVVPDAEFTGDRLLAEVLPRLDDSARLAAMGAAGKRLMRPDAAGQLARIVLAVAGAR